MKKMITKEEFSYICDSVMSALDIKEKIALKMCDKEGVYVRYDEGTAYIGANDKSSVGRAVMLLYKEAEKGNKAFEISQTKKITTCGVMLDMSRNGVMRTDYVKKYLNKMAAFGLNVLMLYTEDTYEMKKYPLFGYRRGRYTKEELAGIDDHAYKLGIELIPCIQTLGHMDQFMKWNKSEPFRDTWSCLFAGEDATYELIEEMIKTLSGSLRSKRIHIGLDEAFDMGLCGYLMKNGYHDRFEIFTKHLKRVVEICKKYDVEPMMWSDMFFRLASKKGEYHDFEIVLPEKIKNEIPDVELVLWSYANNEEEFYEKEMKRHKELGKKVMFAGGVPVWRTLLPDYKAAFGGMVNAMKQCIKQDIDEFLVTVWGDDATETDPFYSLPALAYYSEYFYKGLSADENEIKETMYFVTGFEHEACAAMSEFLRADDRSVGKRVYYTDILYNFTNRLDFSDMIKSYKKALSVLKNCKKRDMADKFYIHAEKVFGFCIKKAEVLGNIRRAYFDKDREYLETLYKEILPDIKSCCDELGREHIRAWRAENKVFGSEVIEARYTVMSQRISYAIDRIGDLLSGKTDRIEELEYEYIDDPSILGADMYKMLCSTSVICV